MGWNVWQDFTLDENIGYLVSILDPVARDVDDCPVEETLWENPLNVDVDDDHRVQGTLLCRPHKSWSLLHASVSVSGKKPDPILTWIRPTPTVALRSTLRLDGHSTNTFNRDAFKSICREDTTSRGTIMMYHRCDSAIHDYVYIYSDIHLPFHIRRVPLMVGDLRPALQSLAPDSSLITVFKT